MPADLKDSLNQILGDTADFAKEELIDFVTQAKDDNIDFVKRIGELTEKNIRRLADMLDLKNMQLHKLSSDAKVRTQKIVNGISDLVINKLFSLIG